MRAPIGLMKGHVRTLKFDTESLIGKEIPDTHNLLTWLVKYAASAYNRFHVGTDGRTPFERLVGRRSLIPLRHLNHVMQSFLAQES